MANIFTRKAIGAILTDENLTPEEKQERIFGLYGQALDDGYTSKSAAQAALNSAIEQAKADALKGVEKPNVKESDDYKELQAQFDAYKTMQTARTSEDYANVKPKFFETVYGMISHEDGAKPVAEQLAGIQEKYEEYFNTSKQDDPPKIPKFGGETKGSAPTGKTGPSFMDTWGFVPKKQ
jgi:hypothetical protein